MTGDAYPGFPRSGEFRTIICDAPWEYRNSRKGTLRVCPYPSMSEEQIFHLPIGEAAAEDAYLLMWYTNSHADLASECIRQYGFERKTTVTWGKITKDRRPRFGTGFYLAGATEHAALCVRGHPPVPRTRRMRGEHVPNHSTLILAPPGRHSAKPEESYVIMEDIAESPRLELFARGPRRAGWSNWGNEVAAARIENFRGLGDGDRPRVVA